ncbi:MAG: flavin reductase family protein [Gemmatimonadota bacterium]
MDAAESYTIIQNLTSPMVAVTTRVGDKLNGMVLNSAIRASLVPGVQRVSFYVFKGHLTHEMLVASGRYVLHLTSRDQWDEIWALGFASGRDADKLEGLSYSLSDTGLPILERCYAWMECEVVNVMDAGPATFFMGEIKEMGRGSGEEMMDSDYFREHMPDEWRAVYLENLRLAQEAAAAFTDPLDDRAWRQLRGEP